MLTIIKNVRILSLELIRFQNQAPQYEELLSAFRSSGDSWLMIPHPAPEKTVSFVLRLEQEDHQKLFYKIIIRNVQMFPGHYTLLKLHVDYKKPEGDIQIYLTKNFLTAEEAVPDENVTVKAFQPDEWKIKNSWQDFGEIQEKLSLIWILLDTRTEMTQFVRQRDKLKNEILKNYYQNMPDVFFSIMTFGGNTERYETIQGRKISSSTEAVGKKIAEIKESYYQIHRSDPVRTIFEDFEKIYIPGVPVPEVSCNILMLTNGESFSSDVTDGFSVRLRNLEQKAVSVNIYNMCNLPNQSSNTALNSLINIRNLNDFFVGSKVEKKIPEQKIIKNPESVIEIETVQPVPEEKAVPPVRQELPGTQVLPPRQPEDNPYYQDTRVKPADYHYPPSGQNADKKTEEHLQKKLIAVVSILSVLVIALAILLPSFKTRFIQQPESTSPPEAETQANTAAPPETAAPSAAAAGSDGFTSVSASSTLNNSHTAAAAFDGDAATSWIEGEVDDGINQTLTVYADTPQKIKRICIYNGICISEEDFKRHNRVKECRITLGDGTLFSAELLDGLDYQPCVIEFPNPVETTQVTFTILSVYAGTTYSDTAITEIEFESE